MSDVVVSSLFVYPIKSFGGVPLDRSNVGKRGLDFDRRWMLVDADGQFMTQRTDTRLALFRITIEEDGLRVRTPSGHETLVPFDPSGDPVSVRVWKDTCEAIQVSTEVDAWFSKGLHQKCSLVYMPETTLRPTHPNFTEPGDVVGFADAFPVLVVSEASLENLNGKLQVPLPINRFRPNIVVKGWEPHQEDTFSRLQVGDLPLRFAKNCGRCSVTTTDQDTGVVGTEPLRTLASYRLNGQAVEFGAYYVPEATAQIAVGDVVLVP